MTPVHPAAELFPLMDDDALIELATDIKENGLHEPIVLLDSAILDGRNRARACDLLGIAPATTEWCGNGTPEAYVVSKNLHRRHLNESQRALIGAKIATRKRQDTLIPNAYRQGGSLDNRIKASSTSNEQAAGMMNVGLTLLQNAKTVLREAAPEDIAAIEQGKTSVGAVVKRIRPVATSKAPTRHVASPGEPKRDREEKRRQTRQLNGALWNTLRNALEGINSLPSPVDVAQAVQQYKRHMDMAKQTKKAVSWLQQFAQAWDA